MSCFVFLSFFICQMLSKTMLLLVLWLDFLLKRVDIINSTEKLRTYINLSIMQIRSEARQQLKQKSKYIYMYV